MWLPLAGVAVVVVLWVAFLVWFHYRVPSDKKQDYAIETCVSALATITAFWLAFVIVFYGVSQTENAAKAREERLQKQLMTARLFYVYQEVSRNKDTLSAIKWSIIEGPTHADAPIHLISTVHVDNLLNSSLYYRFGSSDFRAGLVDVSQLVKDVRGRLGRVAEAPGLELLSELLMVEEALEDFREVIHQEPKLDSSTWDTEKGRWDQRKWPRYHVPQKTSTSGQ